MKICLLLGSNLGDKSKLLALAKKYLIEKVGVLTEATTIHQSVPWGFISEEDFLNQCLVLETKLSPMNLLLEIKRIEKSMGRVYSENKTQTYESRLIDIDILYYDRMKFQSKTLEIPHSQIEFRPFVLALVQEIKEISFFL